MSLIRKLILACAEISYNNDKLNNFHIYSLFFKHLTHLSSHLSSNPKELNPNVVNPTVVNPTTTAANATINTTINKINGKVARRSKNTKNASDVSEIIVIFKIKNSE